MTDDPTLGGLLGPLPAKPDEAPEPEQHLCDWRVNPFVVYQVGPTPHQELLCASPACPGRVLRPVAGTPFAPTTWPKAAQ